MNNTKLDNKMLFDFCKSVQDATDVLSEEELEETIEFMQQARNKIKELEQQRIQMETSKSIKIETLEDGKILYFPPGLTSIDDNVFKDNQEITKVVFNEGLKQIGEYAFSGCVNLKEVIFPQSKIVLRRSCFSDCTSLKSITIPSISCINPCVFENCTALESIFLPSTISIIYSMAFKNCRSLKTVEIKAKESPYNCTHIFQRAFENCLSLETFEFPKNTDVDITTFINCEKLKEIYVHDTWRYYRKFDKCDAKIIKI